MDDGDQARCPLCGKAVPIKRSSSRLRFAESREPSASETDPLGLLLGEAHADRLHNIPETSLEENDSSIGDGNTQTVAGQEKTPVHGMNNFLCLNFDILNSKSVLKNSLNAITKISRDCYSLRQA